MTKTLRHFSRVLAAAALVVSLAFASLASATTITIINNNAAGVGFNDPTPRAPVGGNPGTTLGDQRLNVFNRAAVIWANIVTSAVPITVRAQFAAQTCTATSATLGSTGATTIHRDFTGALVGGHWYVQSLANKLNGSDLSAANPDMQSTFNLSIDSGCFSGVVWYYGFDGLEGSNIEMLSVVLHETAHGLGFATTTNGSTGNYNSSFPSIYDDFLLDANTGLHWSAETPAQRAASAIGIDKLSWDGPVADAHALTYLAHRPRMVINAPGSLAGNYQVGQAAFGPPITSTTGDVVLADDGTAPNPNDACEPLVNGPALAGKVALIDRGTCTFVSKAQAAQAAGAIALLIANNAAGIQPPGGSDPTITIPVVGISQADGASIKTALLSGPVNITLDLDPVALAGANAAGKPLMYTPNPFQSGSSVSHWDVTATPNLLMEPAINQDLHDTTDLTPDLLADIGWYGAPTATTVATFTSESRTDGVMLRWKLSDATQVAVVTVERAAGSATAAWAPINIELSEAAGLTLALDTSAEVGKTYFYRLRFDESDGSKTYSDPISGSRSASYTGPAILSAPAPNPTAGGAAVSYRLGRPEFVRLTIVDATGRRVRTLIEGMMDAGDHVTSWNGQSDRGTLVPAGVYFITLGTSNGQSVQRLAVMR